MTKRTLVEPSKPNIAAEGPERYQTLGCLLLIAALALAIRLAVVPFAGADGGDATARIWIAWSWVSDPTFMPSAVWPPLHFYLMGPVIWLFSDPVVAAIGLHIAFGVVAPLLIYAFTRTEFAGHRAALLVALTFAVYPVLVRNSVSARVEAPFVVFLLGAIMFLALARKAGGTWYHAFTGGAFLTLAGMLRYEAWVLIPLLALVLWRNWHFATIFVLAAMIFPSVWMAASTMEYGNPLYSMMYASNYELTGMGRGEIGFEELLRQGYRYLVKLAKGMTAFVALASVAGVIILLVRRQRSAIWILPLCGLAMLMEMAILRGSLVPKLSYTVILGTLLVPFSAVFYERLRVGRLSTARFTAVAAFMVGSVLLFSCEICWDKLGIPNRFGISPIPRIENQDLALRFPEVVVDNLERRDEGFITDFYGWGVGHHVALMTRLHPDRIYTATGVPNREIDLAGISQFLTDYPSGVLLIVKGSRFAKALRLLGNQAVVNGKTLQLDQIAAFDWPNRARKPLQNSSQDDAPQTIEILRYRVASEI